MHSSSYTHVRIWNHIYLCFAACKRHRHIAPYTFICIPRMFYPLARNILRHFCFDFIFFSPYNRLHGYTFFFSIFFPIAIVLSVGLIVGSLVVLIVMVYRNPERRAKIASLFKRKTVAVQYTRVSAVFFL